MGRWFVRAAIAVGVLLVLWMLASVVGAVTFTLGGDPTMVALLTWLALATFSLPLTAPVVLAVRRRVRARFWARRERRRLARDAARYRERREAEAAAAARRAREAGPVQVPSQRVREVDR